MSRPNDSILDYTNRRRNPSPALERRRRLVREAAGEYVLLLLSSAVVTCLIALLAVAHAC